jgi:aspartate racemase
MKKTIGILGGMGPEATVYMFDLIVKNTAAVKDQDHVPVLVWNDPKVPPRTNAVFGVGPSPLPRLLAGIRILEKGGAGLIVMPCITAHHYAEEIAGRAKVPFINLLDESLRHARRTMPGLKKAGLIASAGTIKSGFFHKTFGRAGIEIIVPADREQKAVTAAIFGPKGIKAGFTTGAPRAALMRVARRLIERGAEAVIAGCTEVPLVLRPEDLSVPLIEPMKAGALAAIKKAGYPIRK